MDNLQKYINKGYTEIIKGEVDHTMYKQFADGNAWIVAFNDGDDKMVGMYFTKEQIDELKNKLK